MKPLTEEGIALNPYESVSFWGLIISSPDPDKVKALKNLRQQRKKEELASFICMMQTNVKLYVT